MPPSDTHSTPESALSLLGRLSRRRLSPGALYDAWLFAETEATLALAAWRAATRRDKASTYAAYISALDAEAAAADRLQMRLAPEAA